VEVPRVRKGRENAPLEACNPRSHPRDGQSGAVVLVAVALRNQEEVPLLAGPSADLSQHGYHGRGGVSRLILLAKDCTPVLWVVAMKEKRSIQIHAYLTPSEFDRIKEYAADNDRKVGWVLRVGAIQWLDTQDRKAKRARG